MSASVHSAVGEEEGREKVITEWQVARQWHLEGFANEAAYWSGLNNKILSIFCRWKVE